MQMIQEFFNQYMVESILVLAGIVLILLIINLILLARTSKMKKNYRELLNGRENINIEELLRGTGDDINRLMDQVIKNRVVIEKLEKRLGFAVQKVGFVRYNAYAEMGSDLSFSFALLDNFLDGFVFTSIYGRDHAAVYGKPIKSGESSYPLSVEEMQAVDRAKMEGIEEK